MQRISRLIFGNTWQCYHKQRDWKWFCTACFWAHRKVGQMKKTVQSVLSVYKCSFLRWKYMYVYVNPDLKWWILSPVPRALVCVCCMCVYMFYRFLHSLRVSWFYLFSSVLISISLQMAVSVVSIVELFWSNKTTLSDFDSFSFFQLFFFFITDLCFINTAYD